jgi:hypothetical protein
LGKPLNWVSDLLHLGIVWYPVSNQNVVLAIVSKTEESVGIVRSKLEGKEDLEILNWLTPTDYGPQQTDFLKRRQAGTGQWLLESEEYRKWLESTRKTLFCPGIPGAGKTILSSIVVSDIEGKFESDTTVGVAYIYYNFRRQEEQKTEDTLSSVLKQLTQSQPCLSDSVRDLHTRHTTKRTRPSSAEICRAIQSVIDTSYSRVFVIVDALDECQNSDGSREQFLSDLFGLQAVTQTSIFATSRFIPEITEEFSNSLVLEIRASEEDVLDYINGHIRRLPGFVSRDPDLQSEIKVNIIKAADGM